MSEQNFATDRYRETQMETASTVDLVKMAYDGIVENLDKASEALEASPKAVDVFNGHLLKAQQIVSALDDGLDESHQGELVDALIQFYDFLRSELIAVNLDKSSDRLPEIISIVKEVRNYWQVQTIEDTNEIDLKDQAPLDLTR